MNKVKKHDFLLLKINVLFGALVLFLICHSPLGCANGKQTIAPPISHDRLHHKTTHVQKPTSKLPHWFVGLDGQLTLLHATGTTTGLEYSNRPGRLVGDFVPNGNSTGFAGGLSAGYAWHRMKRWFNTIQLSLEGMQTLSSPKVSGHWTYTLYSPFDEYRYAYQVKIKTLGIKLSTNIYRQNHIAPFIGIGLGVDWLTISHFEKTPINDADEVSFHFTGAEKRNLYYQGEFGLRYLIKKYTISVSYVYQYLGKVNTGGGQTAVGALSPAIENTLQSHNIRLNVSYYF